MIPKYAALGHFRSGRQGFRNRSGATRNDRWRRTLPVNPLRRLRHQPNPNGAIEAGPTSAGGRPEAAEPPLAPSRRSLRGLDWFIFFVADVQTGFGPFVSVYLTTQRWTQVDIGLVLSADRLRLAYRADAGRRIGRCRSLRARRRRHFDCGDLRERAHLCGAADFSGRAGGIGAARAGELRARPGHCGDQSRTGRPCRDRRTVRPQCTLRLGRQRPGGRRHGRLRLSALRTRRVRRHRTAAGASAVRAAVDLRERNRSRAGARRAAAPKS